MRCVVCEKESNNKRVCPYCFTPYPREEGAQARPSISGTSRPSGASRPSQQVRLSGGGPKATDPGTSITDPLKPAFASVRDFVMRQTPVARWTGAGILFVLLLWAFTGGEEVPTYADGAVPSNIIATPMMREEALALIQRTRETALVEVQGNDEVFVSYQAATFPLREDGQVALAQQFARADEIVEGRKRRITFYTPNARVFARADGVNGVTVVR